MKINHKIKFFIVLAITSLLFNCSNERVSNNQLEENTSNKYTIGSDPTVNNNSGNARLANQTYKYLKVVYPATNNKEFARGIFINALNSNFTPSIVEMTAEANPTDLWIFNDIDQPEVDALFDTNTNSNLCLLCNFTIEVEYVTVLEVCYDADASDNNKQFIRDEFQDDLMHVITTFGSNCEKWVARHCCLGDPICGLLDPATYPDLLSDTDLHNE